MNEVLRAADIHLQSLRELLAKYHLKICLIDDGEAIPGSFWGEEEAGLTGNTLYLRNDTPVHSVLHESSHYICMDDRRRLRLDTNAGSDNAEENAVCYLQVLLADQLDEMGRNRMFADMDSWGYSFRLGSSRSWFESDAEDALDWLQRHQLVDRRSRPTFLLRSRQESAIPRP